MANFNGIFYFKNLNKWIFCATKSQIQLLVTNQRFCWFYIPHDIKEQSPSTEATQNATWFHHHFEVWNKMFFVFFSLCPKLEFPCFLKLFVVVLVLRVVRTFLPVVWRPGLVVAAPVSFADDPRQDVHFIVQVCRKLGADEVGCAGPFASSDKLHIVVVAAVLCGQSGGLQCQHGAYAVPGRGLVDLQLLFWPTGIFPTEISACGSVVYVGCAVRHLGWVRARTARKVVRHLCHVLLQEVALAVHPSLATVRV